MGKNQSGNDSNNNWIYPAIHDKTDARSAALQGVWVCAIISGIKLLVFLFSVSSVISINVTEYSLVEIILFAVFAWRIFLMSRFAAIAATALFALGQVAYITENGIRYYSIIALLLVAFINSIRGTFEYHKMKEPKDQFIASEDLNPEESEYVCSKCKSAVKFGQQKCNYCGEFLKYD